MKTEFTPEFFMGNRSRLRELFTGTAPILVTANGLLQRGGDSIYTFQQDASFWYLTGIDEPDVILVMDKGKEYLIVPFREGAKAAFDGHIEAEELSRRSGVQTILNEQDGWDQLASRLKKVKHAATLAALPAYVEPYSMYTNPARRHLQRKIKKLNSSIELLDISEHLTRLRLVKQPAEITTIQKAIDITTVSLKEAIRQNKLNKYSHEYDIEAELSRSFRRRGGKGHAFDPIVASGKNAATIHYLTNNSPLSVDELIVLDVGAEFDHYSADISRTIALSLPSRRQLQILDAVEQVQKYAFSLLKPGVVLREYEQSIEHYMGEKLRELGLIKSIESETVRKYYPHSASHHLGLNVHDVSDRTSALEPNMVITVEPGIYIPEESIGVRIEDDVLVTDTGIEIMSKSLPTRLEPSAK